MTRALDQTIQLRIPSPRWQQAVMAYRDAFLQRHESLDGASFLDEVEGYAPWLDQIADDALSHTAQAGHVPATAFLITRVTDDRLIGMMSIRHELNVYLHAFGGHIGYSIHPDYRGRGYATVALGQALTYCQRMLHLERVLLTCQSTNVASRMVIEHHHGVLDDVRQHDGHDIERYWIDLRIR